MDNNLDSLIKRTLSDEVKGLSNTDDIFDKIEDGIKTKGDKKAGEYGLYSVKFGYRKYISIVACFVTICIALIVASPYQTRVFAERVISTVRTIFTIEPKDGKLQIVEKPANEAFFKKMAGKTTKKSDKEISNIIGYSVKFPKTLGDSYRLGSKSINLELQEFVDYETGITLNNEMLKATVDDSALARLKPYDPVRGASGMYKKDHSFIFSICVSRSIKLSKLESQIKEYESGQDYELQKVKIGKLDGYWVKLSVPEYPRKIMNGIPEADMTVKPTLCPAYNLFWTKSGTTYDLVSLKDSELTMEEAIKLAEEFAETN